MRTPLVVLGSGGFAREVLNWINFDRYKVVAMFSEDDPSGMTIFGVPVVNDLYGLSHASYVIGVGDPETKEKLSLIAKGQGLKPCKPIIHTSAVVGVKNDIGLGSVVCPFVCITTGVTLGENTIVNLNATIGHDTVMGSNCTISPGANISGRCEIGNNVYIGTNAAIRERVKIGDDSVVGMGAVVIKDVGDSVRVVGSPARPLL